MIHSIIFSHGEMITNNTSILSLVLTKLKLKTTSQLPKYKSGVKTFKAFSSTSIGNQLQWKILYSSFYSEKNQSEQRTLKQRNGLCLGNKNQHWHTHGLFRADGI